MARGRESSMFTRLAVMALTGMSGRLLRRSGLRFRRSRTGSSGSAAVARGGAASNPGVVTATPNPAPATDVSAAAPQVDHFRHLKPVPGPPLLARIAARSLPVLGFLGALVTAFLAIGAVRGEMPFVGAVDGANPAWAAALVTISLWAVFLLWKVPQWQAASWARSGNASPRELFEIENESRGTLGQILSGVAVLTGLIFAWQQLGQTSDNLRVSQEGQITERFTRAVDQLGNDDMTVRLGGVYALERIAHDSPRDYGAVMEILATFVRQKSTLPPGALATPVTTAAEVPLDVRAAYKVIGRRSPDQVALEEGCLDLRGVNAAGLDFAGYNFSNTCWDRSDLRGAILARADLNGSRFIGTALRQANLGGVDAERANFTSAEMAQANFSSADLSDANLLGADMRGATLDQTNLSGADILGTNLESALLFGADLSGADVLDARFTGATISGSNLAGAVHLTAEQIDPAIVDRATTLPEGIDLPPDL